jgi:hypothetical protein
MVGISARMLAANGCPRLARANDSVTAAALHPSSYASMRACTVHSAQGTVRSTRSAERTQTGQAKVSMGRIGRGGTRGPYERRVVPPVNQRAEHANALLLISSENLNASAPAIPVGPITESYRYSDDSAERGLDDTASARWGRVPLPVPNCQSRECAGPSETRCRSATD